jgi:signal transduction histidine kinase
MPPRRSHSLETAEDGGARPTATRPRAYVFALVLWTVPALLSGIETQMYLNTAGHPRPLWYTFMAEGTGWYAWALLTPVILTLAQRMRLTWPPRAKVVAVHLAVLAGGAVLHGIVDAACLRHFVLMPPPHVIPFWNYVGRMLLSYAPVSLVSYALIVGAGMALGLARELRVREQHEAALGEALARAELSALRSQLQPHFVFNTLHSIGLLMREGDTERARRVVQLFADVLRNVLHADATAEVPLATELDVLARYLAIEETRFEDRLRVQWCTDPALGDALVPALVLQPLVENAIRHGIAPRAAAGVLEVGSVREGDSIRLWVRDDGAGVDRDAHDAHDAHDAYNASDARGDGIGLRNTRARLAGLYGDRASLTLAGADGGGTIATVRLPYHEARA